ncbi:YncE family protein [Kitasatospora aureofaciens]|uniref:YncE family protein n=1 Tax=Kitasatospora aureofaciens TaxID=1894 RepID=UPI001C46F598|nr:YncE family protein [Kitasatospora aureofaciens]MBV6696830.1 YncE family protein [Kitasatospora aureofaciens]
MTRTSLPSLRRAVCVAAVLSVFGAGTAAAAPSAGRSVIGPVAVGGTAGAVVLSPDGRQAFVVTNDWAHSTAAVKVVDTGSGAVAATVPLPGSASQVAVSPDGTVVYALAGKAVTVIDTADDSVLSTFPLPDQPLPNGWDPQQAWGQGALKSVAVSPDGSSLYIGQDGAGTFHERGNARVLVLDAETGVLSGSVETTVGDIGDILVHPDGKDVYVSSASGFGLVHLDVEDAQPTVVKTVIGSSGDWVITGATMNTDGSYIYATFGNSARMQVIRTADDTPLAAVTMGTGTTYRLDHPVLSHDNLMLYMPAEDSAKGSTVDTLDNIRGRVLTPIPGVGPVSGAAISRDDTTLYLTTGGTLRAVTVG